MSGEETGIQLVLNVSKHFPNLISMKFEVLLVPGYALEDCASRFAFLRSHEARRQDTNMIHADITLSVS
jgi:hypothetical protein